MEWLMELVNGLLGNQWVSWGTGLVTAFSAFAAVTATPAPGTFWAKVYSVFDWLALNVGKAKDKS